MTLLSELLPEYDFRERHSIEIDAPPTDVMQAVKAVTIEEMPIVRSLFRLRGLPTKGEVLELEGFAPLGEEADREIVVGGVGQPWRATGGMRRGVDFRSFVEPGYAKMAMSFRVDGGTLSTETRVLLTDAGARRKFRRYWLAIRPFSGVIRRLWLRAAKRRAEAPR